MKPEPGRMGAADTQVIEALEKGGARFPRPDGAGPVDPPVEAELSGEKVGDAGVATLKALTRLKKLTLHTTAVTDCRPQGVGGRQAA
ncbi:MAG: hypothetical protein JWO38_6876 [Gemmataceae bacterium]|nr:hypothetical protein [Gemmataceae bacterium]